MTTPHGWVVTYISGNQTAIIGAKPEPHEIIKSIEPFFLGHTPILPANASMVPHIEKAYLEGYEHGKKDKTFMPTIAQRRRIALIGATAFIKAQSIEHDKAPDSDWVAAAEHLAFSVHGVPLAELSDKERADAHRWARSTINAALHIKG